MQRRTTFLNLIGSLVLCLLHSVTNADLAREFNDHDLARLLKNHTRGVIYLWSPHMPYSVQGASEARRVAQELAVESVLLLDPYADSELTSHVLQSQRLPSSATRRVRADALAKRGATQHFPTAIVFERGRLDVQMLPGYTPPEDLRAYIRQRLKNF